MDVQTELREKVPHGSIAEVRAAIESNISLIEQHLDYVRIDAKKTDRNMVLYNLAIKVKVYLHCLLSSLPEATEQIAFVTRSLFELGLIVQYVLKSEENLKLFLEEAELDQRDILEGMLEIQKYLLEAGLKMDETLPEETEALLKQHVHAKKLPNYKLVAIEVGLEHEYNAQYKLLSKYVHPTSYSVNTNTQTLHDPKMRNFFLFMAQLYAHQAFDQIRRATTGEGLYLLDQWALMLLDS